jgi:hypothetical protein
MDDDKYRKALLKKLRDLYALKLKPGVLDAQQSAKLAGEASLRAQLAQVGVSRAEQEGAHPAVSATPLAPSPSAPPGPAGRASRAEIAGSAGRAGGGGSGGRGAVSGRGSGHAAAPASGIDCRSLGRATSVGEILAAVAAAGPGELTGARAAHGLHAAARLIQTSGGTGGTGSCLNRAPNRGEDVATASPTPAELQVSGAHAQP